MTIWRWLKDKSLNFPKPLVINGRRYWRSDELEKWELTQVKTHDQERRADDSAADVEAIDADAP